MSKVSAVLRKPGEIISSLFRLLKNNIKGIVAAFGVIFLLFATTLPGISFVFASEWQDDPADLMWNGDLVNPESEAEIPYEEAQRTWAPFLTGPLTPLYILYLAAILAILGIILRTVCFRMDKPAFEKLARFSVQIAIAVVWIALGVFLLYFLTIQSSSRGIQLFDSLGAILVIISSIALIPIATPHDFEGG